MSLRRVLLTALLLRLAVPFAALAFGEAARPTREPDSHQYVELARALVQRGEFALEAGPEVSRTPGYSLFLAPGVWLGSVDAYAIIAQAALGAVAVWLTARIAEAAGGDPAAGRRAAWWLALEPLSILYCGKLLTESIFTSCLLAGLLGLLQFQCAVQESGGPRRAGLRLAQAAAGFAAAMFVRPIAYYWPFVAVAWLALAQWGRASRGRALATAVALVVMCLAPAVAWQIRNVYVADYGGFSAIVDENLLFWQGAGVLAEREGADLSDVQTRLGYSRDAIFVARHPELKTASRGEVYRAKGREGIDLIRSAPMIAIRQHLAGVWSTLSDPGTNAWLHYFSAPPDDAARANDEALMARLWNALRKRPIRAGVHVWLCLALLTYWGAAVVGFVRGRSWRRSVCWLLVLAGAYFALSAGGPNAYHRMRLPIMPLLCVFAAMAPMSFFNRRQAALAAATLRSAQ